MNSESTQPYGPATPAVRRFLVRLAALGPSEREQVVTRHAAESLTRPWHHAENALGTLIERSGRSNAQEAVSGPLLQLVRRHDAPPPSSEAEALQALDPLAEPALAALLALMMQDLMTPHDFTTLYAPFAELIPVSTLQA